MSLFKHLLIPVDFTSKNSVALDIARDLARMNDSRVTLLHVIEAIDCADDLEITAFYESLQEQAVRRLKEYARAFEEESLDIHNVIVMGKAANQIIQFAMQEGVELIVLSSHKMELNKIPTGWATLSHQISILSQCPVMLVK